MPPPDTPQEPVERLGPWPKKLYAETEGGLWKIASDPQRIYPIEVVVVPASSLDRMREERDRAEVERDYWKVSSEDWSSRVEAAEKQAAEAREALQFIARPDHDWREKPLGLEWASEIARAALPPTEEGER